MLYLCSEFPDHLSRSAVNWGACKHMRKRAKEPQKGSNTRTQINKPETGSRVQTGLDELHRRIQSKLDELHTDFRQPKTDLNGAEQASSRAQKDRIEGFKQALRDILEAAEGADREWH